MSSLLALLDGVLGRLEPVVAERQRHRSRRSPRSGRSPRRSPRGRTGVGHVLAARPCGRLDPGLPALVAEQPVEALGLQGEQVRNLERLLDACENDTRRGPAGTAEALREAANRCPSEGSRRTDYTHARRPCIMSKRSGSSKGSAKGQCSRTAHTCPLRSRCKLHVGRSIARQSRNVKPESSTFSCLRAWTLGFLPCVIGRLPPGPRRYPRTGAANAPSHRGSNPC